MAALEITTVALATVDELLIQVGQMQTGNSAIDELLRELAEGEGHLDACDLADARHEVATIARALRALTRIGEGHDAKLREDTDG